MAIFIKILLLAVTDAVIIKATGHSVTIEGLHWMYIFGVTAFWSLNNIEIMLDNLHDS